MTMFSEFKSRSLKWNLNFPWMTRTERDSLKSFRRTGEITSFRIQYCEGRPLDKDKNPQVCPNEVPIVKDNQGNQIKRFCSKRCHDTIEKKESDNGPT